MTLKSLLPQTFIAVIMGFALITNPLPSVATELNTRTDLAAKTAKNLSSDEQIIHVLNRLGYGSRPGDVERIRKIGLDKYIDQQLNPDKIDDHNVEAHLKDLDTLKMDVAQLVRAYPLAKFLNDGQKPGKRALANNETTTPAANSEANPEDDRKARRLQKKAPFVLDEKDVKGKPSEILLQLSQEQLLRAVYSDRQLYELMVDFWTNHFNIFWAKAQDKYLLTSYMHEVIRPNAMGSFPKLLSATAHSPAMLVYLDNWLSVDPNAAENNQRQRAARREQVEERREERIARRSLGRPNRPFGRPPIINTRPLPSPRPLPNPQTAPKGKRAKAGLNENYARELMELHTLGVEGGYTQKDVTEVARCFTGWTIKRAGDDQEVEFQFNERFHDNGEKVVLGTKISGDGKHDGEKVLEILAKNPATAHFLATKLVRYFIADEPPANLVNQVATTYTKTNGDIRAMLRTIIASPDFFAQENYHTKVKSPLALVASTLRAADADTTADIQIFGALNRMGEPLFLCQPPTGYGDTADKWVNTAALVERLNFAVAVSEGRVRGTMPNIIGKLANIDSLDGLIQAVMYGNISDTTRNALAQEMGKERLANKTPKLVGLLLGSPEFQKK